MTTTEDLLRENALLRERVEMGKELLAELRDDKDVWDRGGDTSVFGDRAQRFLEDLPDLRGFGAKDTPEVASYLDVVAPDVASLPFVPSPDPEVLGRMTKFAAEQLDAVALGRWLEEWSTPRYVGRRDEQELASLEAEREVRLRQPAAPARDCRLVTIGARITKLRRDLVPWPPRDWSTQTTPTVFRDRFAYFMMRARSTAMLARVALESTDPGVEEKVTACLRGLADDDDVLWLIAQCAPENYDGPRTHPFNEEQLATFSNQELATALGRGVWQLLWLKERLGMRPEALQARAARVTQSVYLECLIT